MGIAEVLSAPRSPWQRAYVERVIGSIRRECLDHVIVFEERSLRRILASYVDYYHRSRTHLSLGKDSPRSTAGSAARNRARRGGASGRWTASPLRAPRRLNPPKVPPATRVCRQDRVCRCRSSFTLALWAPESRSALELFPTVRRTSGGLLSGSV